MTRVRTCHSPYDTAFHVEALGGGVGLALLCDLRIATSPAHYLALTECKRGLVPALISLYVVPALPQSLVMEMMVFGERVGVLRLLQVGVFNGVVVGQRGSTSSGIGKTSGSDISTGNDTSSNDNGTHFPTVDAAMTYYTAAIATSAPQASRTIKQLVHRLNRSAIDRDDDNKQYVRAIFRAMMASEEALYGMMCFMQKEKPDWARLPVSDLEAKAKAKL